MNVFKQYLIRFINKLPYVRGLVKRIEYYQNTLFFPPEHYYSPIVSPNEVKEQESTIWGGEKVKTVEGVALNLSDQLHLIHSFIHFASSFPFPDQAEDSKIFRLDNDYFAYHDAFILYAMFRHYSPQRVIEVGSGFSSALMLEINEKYFQETQELHFIEPFPEERLTHFLAGGRKAHVHVKKIQEVDSAFFLKLGLNDLLFIDSSHVSKTGSDLNFILFTVLPVLKPGVLIHFHDIFYPFEYPLEWVCLGRSWNEAYLLRAFLMHNLDYKIIYFNDAISSLYPEVASQIPVLGKSRGSSLWIQKIR